MVRRRRIRLPQVPAAPCTKHRAPCPMRHPSARGRHTLSTSRPTRRTTRLRPIYNSLARLVKMSIERARRKSSSLMVSRSSRPLRTRLVPRSRSTSLIRAHVFGVHVASLFTLFIVVARLPLQGQSLFVSVCIMVSFFYTYIVNDAISGSITSLVICCPLCFCSMSDTIHDIKSNILGPVA